MMTVAYLSSPLNPAAIAAEAGHAQYIQRLRSEAKAHRLRAQAAERTLAELHNRLAPKLALLALIDEGMRAGIIDPDAVKMADARVVVDDDFAVHGAAEAVAKLKAAKPYLFAGGRHD